MPLTTRSTGQSPIDSSAVNQYYQALTGGMADQPFTLANTLTVTNTLTGSSNLSIAGTGTITGKVTGSSAAQFTGGMFSSTITSSGVITADSGLTSSQRTAFSIGSSGPTIQFGSSIPTSAALPGSLFINVGGSSVQLLYVAAPNAGTASSSNWAPVTLG